MTSPTTPTVTSLIQKYLSTWDTATNKRTFQTYSNALRRFCAVLRDNGLDPDTTPPLELNENGIRLLIDDVQASDLAPKTQILYVTIAQSFYNFLASEDYPVNTYKLAQIIKQRVRKPRRAIPRFDRDEIERLIEYAAGLNAIQTDDEWERLRALRDRALILVLADTGLRIHEACNLNRGDVDPKQATILVTGKGNKDAWVHFSARSLAAVMDYLNARRGIDGSAGRLLATLPVFARHDKGGGKKVKRITTRTGQNIIADRAREANGSDCTIHPHLLRHYFVTRILETTDNLFLAQQLARHASPNTTVMYAHPDEAALEDIYRRAFDG